MAGAFDGGTQRVNLGRTFSTRNKTALSVSFWWFPRGLTANRFVFAYTEGVSSNAPRIGMSIQNPSGESSDIRVEARGTDGTATGLFTTSGTPITRGNWYHLVAVVDYGSSLAQIWRDGAILAEGAFSPALNGPSTSDTDSLSGAIGAGPDGAFRSNGLIADLRLYDRLLGENEVATLFACRGHDGISQGMLDRYWLQGPSGVVITATPNIGSAGTPAESFQNSPIYADDILSLNRKLLG